MVDTWEAHKLPVQTVVTLPSGEIITGISLFFYILVI